MKRDVVALKRARRLRREQTEPERQLWHMLRASRLGGIKFSRQVPIGPYIADFAARREKLIVELDGDSHGGRQAYDAARTAWLESQGYRVLRFSNSDFVRNPDGILEEILAIL